MTIEEAIKGLKNVSTMFTGYKPNEEMFAMAIRSLEAWEKVEKEINESISICRESAQYNNWFDGELAGFLQSKDIIDGNLSEVSE